MEAVDGKPMIPHTLMVAIRREKPRVLRCRFRLSMFLSLPLSIWLAGWLAVSVSVFLCLSPTHKHTSRRRALKPSESCSRKGSCGVDVVQNASAKATALLICKQKAPTRRAVKRTRGKKASTTARTGRPDAGSGFVTRWSPSVTLEALGHN